MILLCFQSRESLLAMEAWSTSPKGGLGVEPKCIAGIYSSTHIALDATHNDVVMITTYLFFLSCKVALVVVYLAFSQVY